MKTSLDYKGKTPDACRELNATSKAVDSITTKANEVQGKFTGWGGSTGWNRGFGLLTYGLVTAVAVKTMHGTDGNAAKNLALGAGATYAASTYFTPPTIESLYLATHTELICFAAKGEEFIAGYANAQSLLKEATTQMDSWTDTNGCPVSVGIATITAARNDAKDAIARAQSMDPEIGRTLNSAANNVVTTMNKQLSAQTPSIDAITKAGGVATTFASGLLAKPSTPQAKPLVGAQVASNQLAGPLSHIVTDVPIVIAKCSVDADTVSRVKLMFDAAKDTMVKELNKVGDLAQGCTAAASVPIQPLTVANSQITLDRNQTFTIVVTGGRQPYFGTWVTPT